MLQLSDKQASSTLSHLPGIDTLKVLDFPLESLVLLLERRQCRGCCLGCVLLGLVLCSEAAIQLLHGCTLHQQHVDIAQADHMSMTARC